MSELETLQPKSITNVNKENNDLIPEKIDIITSTIGNFGRWQFCLGLMMFLLRLSIGWFQMGIIFLAPPQKYWCKKPEIFSNYTDSEWRNISNPGVNEETSCTIYNPTELFGNVDLNKTNISTVLCPEFVFDTTIFTRSIVSEWFLICSRSHYIEISQSTMMFGVLVGTLLFGILADLYGKKRLLLLSITIQALTGFASALVPWFIGFVIFRFILGMSSGGIVVLSFVLCMEVVGGKWMTILPIIIQTSFCLGTSILASLAFLFRDWRKLQISLSVLSSLYLVYFWFIPESPRWLLVTGKRKQAIDILKKAAKQNKLDESKVEALVDRYINKMNQDKKTTGLNVLLKHKNLRFRTILLNFQWLGTGMVTFGFIQFCGELGENIFLNALLTTLIVIPTTPICIFTVRHLGRRLTIMSFQFLSAASILILIFIPKDKYAYDFPRLILGGVSILGMTVYIITLSVFTGELYPTIVRNKGIAFMTVFCRLGTMVAPFIVSLKGVSPSLPLIVLALILLCQILIIHPLPETMGQPLIDTVEQGELLNNNV